MPTPKHPLSPSILHRSKAFEVPGLPSKYPLTVYLPPGYATSHERYPVAYMFDGQNLFSDEGSYSGGWYLHESLDALAAKGKRVPIVIGIHHGGASRISELSPWAVKKGAPGKGDRQLDWVVGRLREMVAEEMRVLTGPEHTLIGGSSLGGLMALYGLCKHPDVFGNCMALSPSIWVNGGRIFHQVKEARLRHDTQVYLDYGGREPGFRNAQMLAEVFEQKGLGDNLLWRPDAKGTHSERHWRRRLPKALRFFYG